MKSFGKVAMVALGVLALVVGFRQEPQAAGVMFAALTVAQVARPVKRMWSGSDRDAVKTMYDSLKTFRFGRVTVNVANMAAGAEVDTVIALPTATFGAVTAATHMVFVQPPDTLNAGIYIRRWWISAANQVTITTRNETGGAVDPAAADFAILVLAPYDVSTLL
jgi:hypothetical protein